MKQALIKQLNYAKQSSYTSLPRGSMLQFSQFGYKKTVRKIVNEDYLNDMAEYKKKMSEMRAIHRKNYWEHQTQIENAWLEKFRKERLEKQRRDLDRWRTSIINVCMHTKNQIKSLETKEKDLLRKLTEKDLRDTKKAMENRMMLDVMQIESRKWPTLADLHTKIDENVVLPQTIMNYGEYQMKLQNLAFYAEQGDHESMQKLLDKEDVMEKKNLLLQPIFRDLKSIIKHMTLTEEYKILKEYIDNRALILQNFDSQSEKGKEGLKALEQEYAKLLKNYKNQLADPSKRLKILQKRLEDVFQLLNLWTQYVEIIYMPESEIHVIDAISKMDARPEDSAYSFRQQEQDVKKRLNVLFGKEEEIEGAAAREEEETQKAHEEDYETVNEGMTTDTTEAAETSFRRGQVEEEGTRVERKQKDQEENEDEGILSSDEEDQQAQLHFTEKVVKQSKVKAKSSQKEEIKSFTENNNKKNGLFESDKTKEELENRYNFGEVDLEKFQAKLQSKGDREGGAAKVINKEEDEDKEYVKDTDYSAAKLEELDMESLNLFGIPIGESDESLKDTATNKETQKVIQELIELTEQFDSNTLSNFQIRKSFVYYDPYDPDESITYAFLKFEDQLKLRASIVLDYYKQELNSLDNDILTFADKERKEQVLKLLNYLGSLKIVDAQVLLKIYDLYRFKI